LELLEAGVSNLRDRDRDLITAQTTAGSTNLTNEENTMKREENTGRYLEDEDIELKDGISRLLYARYEVTYKLEQAVRERERPARHVASSTKE
jgi:hypothetical protein